MTDRNIIEIKSDELRSLIEGMPTSKRAAFGKALSAAIEYAKAGGVTYDKAFPIAKAMVLNEWHLGEELPKLVREGRPKNCSSSDSFVVTLSEIGLTRSRSERAQRIRSQFARREIEAWIDDQYDHATYKLPRISQASTEAKRKQIVHESEIDPPTGEYRVVVIDPPWPMEKIDRETVPDQAGFDYATMDEDKIAAYCPPCAEDCHVWLWTTHRFLPMAFRLLGRWDLSYVCCFVWHKAGGFQPFGLPQYNCEFALYSRRGSPTFSEVTDFKVCFDAKRTGHSEKPSEFYDLVRRVTFAPRLDMYSRREIDGFDSWGNEAPKEK